MAETFRPDTLRAWAGPVENHHFNPARASDLAFPPVTWDSGIGETGEVWYEFEVPADALPPGLAGFYISRVYLTVDLYLNGQLIGSGGAMDPPMAKNAHRPLYFPIPAAAWEDAGNVIRIRHKSYPGMGYLIDFQLGSDTELRPVFEQRYFWLQSVPRVLFMLEMFCAVLVFYIWISRPSRKAYLWFTAALLSLGVFTLNQFLINTGISHKAWLTLNNTSIEWWVICLNFFVYRQLSVNLPRLEQLQLLFGCAAFAYYLALPVSRLPGTMVFHAVALLVVLMHALWLLHRYWHRQKEVLPYLVLFACLAGVAGHDLLLQSGIFKDALSEGHFMLFYVAPVLCLLMVGQVVREFVSAMRQKEEYAGRLEANIEAVRKELDLQYSLLQEASLRQAESAERERIYRDLHDDVGSKLLSMYYIAEKTPMGKLAKSALEDLRDIVSRPASRGEMLAEAVQQWHGEAWERTQEAGIGLEWVADIMDSGLQLSETQFTQLRRILREALSNAINHADATLIRVLIEEREGLLNMVVENNGVKAPAATWTAGRGINNFRIRAAELGGECSIRDVIPGTVRFSLQARFPRDDPGANNG